MGNLRSFQRRNKHKVDSQRINNEQIENVEPLAAPPMEEEANPTLEAFRRDCEAAPGRIEMIFNTNFKTGEPQWLVGKNGARVGFYPYACYKTFEEAKAAYPDAFITASAKREVKRLKSLK